MGGRYWITGVQLGMLMLDNEKVRLELIQKIIDTQFMGSIGDKEVSKLLEDLK